MEKEYSVLIIDDDIWIQRILSKTLQSFGFNRVLTASDGFNGVAKAVEHLPFLIITDILMPEITGHQVLRLLKTIKKTKDIPVIMISAMSDTTNIGIAAKAGIAGFISKPFSRATIYDKLVSIFGEEKMNLISNGIFEETNKIDNSLIENNNVLPEFKFDVDNIDSTIFLEDYNTSESPKTKAIQTQYGDDEKKSIESIKKLLNK